MKAAIYTRVSTDNQAEVEFNSCETQESKIRSFIASQNGFEVYKVYSDQGHTGANMDRPALKDMLIDIQRGKIDIVIAYKIDRLTRSPKDFYQLIEIFEKHNVSFLSITERFDTSTPSGRLLRNIMLTFAQFERELISERIKDKILEKARKGLWGPGRAPFGYQRDGNKLVIVPEEAKIVKTIFEDFLATHSTQRIYEKLKSNKQFNRAGLPHSKTGLDSILKSIVHAGMIEHKGTIYQGLHEPIISKEVFDEIQVIRKNHVRPKKMTTFNFSLFPGLIRCKECGSVMIAVFTNKVKYANNKRTRYFYYRCSVLDKRDRSFCGIRQVSADRLDKFIVENLDRIRKNKQYLDSLTYVLNNDSNGSLNGCEPTGGTSPIRTERVQEILKTVIDAAKLKGKTEKRLIIKRHIEKVIYSKETIEVKLLYSDSVEPCLPAGRAASGPLRDPAAEADFSLEDKDAATSRHLSAPQSRRPSAMVRCKRKMPRPIPSETIPFRAVPLIT